MRLPAMIAIYILVLFNKIISSEAAVNPSEQAKADAFLTLHNSSMRQWNYKKFTAMWMEATNLTKYNQNVRIKTTLAFASYEEEIRSNASRFNISQLNNDTARQLKLIRASTELKNASERAQKETLLSQMTTIYSTAKVTHLASIKYALLYNKHNFCPVAGKKLYIAIYLFI